jgi:hypothetical protein
MSTDKQNPPISISGSKGDASAPGGPLLKLLSGWGLAWAFTCLALAAAAHLISHHFVFQLGAIIFAELGAVLFSIRFLHLMYEKYLRDEHIFHFESSMKDVIRNEFRNTENSRAFIEEAKKIFIEAGSRDLESYLSFQRIGIRAVYEDLPRDEVGRRLAGAKRIDVMKTWFPDHPDIQEGFKLAMTSGAEVRLLLSHPKSVLLGQRSLGAKHNEDHGSWQVTRTLLDIYEWELDKFEIGLYDEWPGCPTIWYDKRVLLGFYLRGRSSPFWPWLEIEAGSPFDKILCQQFNDLWKIADKISNRTELAVWLKARGELK